MAFSVCIGFSGCGTMR
ncbi:hypothetical protein M2G59_20835 [Vibrio vulnificus]|nr:hypothetical protein [Vibrio vulnificus]MCU8492476.1 hypothetical protein [Vibrio vulnificus]